VSDTQGAVSNQATVTVTVGAASAEVVIDNGRPGTSFIGDWSTSGAPDHYGPDSFWSRDGSTYSWSFVASVSGPHEVSMWWSGWPSRSTSVPVDIRHSGGTARVYINQGQNGGRWNSLGVYSFVAGASYSVTITSQPGPSSTCADAVKFAYFADLVEYVAVGDSITFGSHDDIPADGYGYEPILASLLTASNGYPNIVINEGVSGDTSADGAIWISDTLASHPSAEYYLVMYGTNDAFFPAVPSGLGLNPGDPGYIGSFKESMQNILSAIIAAGKTPYLAKVPYTTDPLISITSIQNYNLVIDELFFDNGIMIIPPDFYSYFQSHPGELDDGIHPNGMGYRSMADMWFAALSTP
jgi:lysophospholipase L1-like esterase